MITHAASRKQYTVLLDRPQAVVFFVGSTLIKPALKGEVDMSVSEWTEGLKKERRFSLYRQPLSQ